MDSVFNLEEDNYVGTQPCVSKLLLRSRPTINFSECFSAIGSDHHFPTAAHHPCAPSHISGSKLNSSFNPSLEHLHSCKTYAPTIPSNLGQDISSDVITSLTPTQLYQNPLHHHMMKKYENSCEIILQRDLEDAWHARQSDITSSIAPNTYQGTLFFTSAYKFLLILF
jgi:hypothetical protein